MSTSHCKIMVWESDTVAEQIVMLSISNKMLCFYNLILNLIQVLIISEIKQMYVYLIFINIAPCLLAAVIPI